MKSGKRYKKKKLGSYPNISVVFSVTLALFVIGLFGLLFLHTNEMKEALQGNFELQIYLNKHITENQRIKVRKTLNAKPYLLHEEGIPQINYISKEEAGIAFIEATGEDFQAFLGENPLRDAYTIKITPEYQSNDALKKIKSEVELIAGIFEVTYMENLVDDFNKNKAKIGMVLIGFSAILLITIVILINNTIKLAMFSQRFLIRSMQLVGAKASFIQGPFIWRSIAQGIASGILASLFLMSLLEYANQRISGLDKLQDINKILVLFALLIIIGMLVSTMSTFRAIKKYLRMSLDDLY